MTEAPEDLIVGPSRPICGLKLSLSALLSTTKTLNSDELKTAAIPGEDPPSPFYRGHPYLLKWCIGPPIALRWLQEARKNPKMVPVGKRQPQEEQEVNCSSIRDPRTTRVRKPRPWRIPRAIQEDWAKNSWKAKRGTPYSKRVYGVASSNRKATKRGVLYSKRVYCAASTDAPKKARKIRYVRRPPHILLIRNCNQIS